ncbi:MAG TPA: hypothetical protein VD741_04570 [Solirubrobacterales bacterium]|nr:hypothetical protein [Solirubrobacterales bacterium]
MQQGFRCFLARRLRFLQIALVAIAATLGAGATLPAGASAAPTQITEIPVDFGHWSNLEGLVFGPDGNLWFSDHWWPEGQYHASIGRMDEAGNAEEFDAGLNEYSSIAELVPGPGGDVWFADDGSALGGAAIGRISSDGTITRYTAGLGGARPWTIMAGPDGNLWFTAGRNNPAIGFATPEGEITTFSLPGSVWDAVAGPDGNVWFTYADEGVTPAIGRVVMKEDGGATITLFHKGLAADSVPREIVAAQDGNLWFADNAETTTAIGKVSMSGQIQEFPVSSEEESGIWDIATGPTGDIWFTNRGTNEVGRVTPQGQVTTLQHEQVFDPRWITPGPDGNMWFTQWGGIGKVTPTGAITNFREGLIPNATPGEIVSGPNGRLWFIGGDGSTSAIGRIVPGDDNPPAPEAPPQPPQPSYAFGRLALPKTNLRVSPKGRTTLPIACQSSTPCFGSFRIYVFRSGWKAGRKIAESSFSVGAWGSAGVRVQITKVGKKLLEKNDEVIAWLHASPRSGALPVNQRLRLRLAAPRR